MLNTKYYIGQNFKALLSCLLFFILLLGCRNNSIVIPPDTKVQVTITQGVWGNVWFWSGNFMPMSESGTVTPVVRQLFIYEPTPYDSVIHAKRLGGFYRTINSKLVTTASSNSTGFFQVSLPPGNYSIFVKEDSLYWMGMSDAMGIIGGFKVSHSAITKMQVDINYEAAY
jgi:hypothetical protein